MRKLSSKLAGQQSGFTLIELVIVIVIIGILAAVAIPNFANVTDSANRGVNKATLGAVKTAWSTAYAVNKVVPSGAQIATQTLDPKCTSAGAAGAATTISCPAKWTTASPTGAGGLSITYDGALVSSMVCTTATDCD